jgi:hypothetical protein
MRKIIITVTLSIALVAALQAPGRADNFEGPNIHWGRAYNDPNGTYRAFALHDRTNDFAWQTAIQGHVRTWNGIRQQFNMGLPWKQYVLDNGTPCYPPASGEVTTCRGHNSDVGKDPNTGRYYTGITQYVQIDYGTGYGWHFLDARVIFNADYTWNANGIANVVCHELGHAVGLGHSAYTDSCMYASLATTPNYTLWYDADDNNTLNKLYAHAPWL